MALADHQAFDAQLVRVERNPWILGLAALPFVGALALAVAGLFDPRWWMAIVHASLIGAMTTTYAWRKNFRSVLRPTQVRVDARGVTIGRHFVRRTQIRAGFVKPLAGAAPSVLLERTSALPIELRAASLEVARALLRALGLDVSQTVAEFRTLSRMLANPPRGRIFGLLFAPFVLGVVLFDLGSSHLGLALFALFFPLMFGFVLLSSVATRVRVGVDGIETRWLLTRRFLAYGEISSVGRYERDLGNLGKSKIAGLRLELVSGEDVWLPIRRGTWDRDQIPLIEERIREAIEGFRGDDVSVEAALLARGDRAVGAWVAELRSIGAGANATLRTAPVPHERLMRIALDPSQSPSARAAAAVALGRELDDDGRERLRMASEATVLQKLRVAIEKAASGQDDAAMEEALSEVALASEGEKSPSRIQPPGPSPRLPYRFPGPKS